MAACRQCQKTLTHREELLSILADRESDRALCEACQWDAHRRRKLRVVK